MRVQAAATYFRRFGLIVFTLASIGAILLIWMHGVKHALLRQESPSTQSPQEERERSEYSHTDFRGDLVGYAARSVALKSVRSETVWLC